MRFSTSAVVLSSAASAAAQSQAACAPLELVYARATGELPTGITVQTTPEQWDIAAAKHWSKGYGAAGASLLSNLTVLLPQAAGYAVPYPANWQANTSAPTGVKLMLERLEAKAKACPKTLFALGGHSQGSGVTASAIPKISKDLLSKVIAVTMFGGRPCPAEVQDRCRSYCNAGDGCMPGAKDAKGAKGAKGGKGMPKFPKGGKTGAAPPPAAGPKGDAPLSTAPLDVPPPKEVSPPAGVTPPKAVDPAPANAAFPPPKIVPGSAVAPGPSPSPASVGAPPVLVPGSAIVPQAAPTPAAKGPAILGRQSKVFTCANEEPPTQGHVPIIVKGESAHTVYNKDGFYITTGACYIFKKYQEATGSTKPAGK